MLSGEARAAWFEVHPENYLGEGVVADILEKVRHDVPVSLHATGLSLGSADGIDPGHLAAIADLAGRIQPGLISDHLSWSAIDGVHIPDLLPLPYTREALDIFVRNIDRVQTALGRAILIENPSVYLAFAHSEMREGEFLAALARASGCGLLLDINNVAVSAANLGERPMTACTRCWTTCPPPPSVKSIWPVTPWCKPQMAALSISTITARPSAMRYGTCMPMPSAASALGPR